MFALNEFKGHPWLLYPALVITIAGIGLYISWADKYGISKAQLRNNEIKSATHGNKEWVTSFSLMCVGVVLIISAIFMSHPENNKYSSDKIKMDDI